MNDVRRALRGASALSPRVGEPVLARFRRDERGNIGMILGLALVPLMTVVGAAIDYSVANERKVAFQSAADSAALAGARRLGGTDAQVEAAIRAYLDANMPSEFRGIPFSYTVSADRRTLDVTLEGSVATRFLGLIGYTHLDVAVSSQATVGIDRAEVVLALDTTGTMRSHIPALQQGARDLTRILRDAAADPAMLRIGLVPYVAAVNVGNHPDRMSWMDTNARARFHGENFENVRFGDSRCDPPPPPPPPPAPPAPPAPPGPPPPPPPPGPPPPPSPPPPPPPWSPDLGWLEGDAPTQHAHAPQPATPAFDPFAFVATEADAAARPAPPAPSRLVRVVDAIAGAFAPAPAAAQTSPTGYPYGSVHAMPVNNGTPGDLRLPSSVANCDHRTPRRVNHFNLFRYMGVAWKGCVEARPYPLDVRDDPPTGADDNRFVPYLWPDENGDPPAAHPNQRNNYLADALAAYAPPWWVDRSVDGFRSEPGIRQAWVWKYQGNGPGPMAGWVPPNVDNASFLTRGPNAACPDPIVPLTSNVGTVNSALGRLRAYAGSGTNIAEGLAWAWRVISPGAPFTEGAAYDRRNRKFIVLMTDGFNEVVPQGEVWGWGTSHNNMSDYSAIGYAAKARLGSTDLAEITRTLDRRLTEVCTNIKNAHRTATADQQAAVQIFTLLYDPVGYTASSDVQNRLRDCATTPNRHFYRASSQEELVRAFNEIANEITQLRLSR